MNKNYKWQYKKDAGLKDNQKKIHHNFAGTNII